MIIIYELTHESSLTHKPTAQIIYTIYIQYTYIYIYTHIYALSILIHTSYTTKIELVATVSISLRAVGDQRKLINFSPEPVHQLVL